MNNQQWASLIRIVLGVLLAPSSYLVLKGILTPDQASQLIPILEPIILAAGAAALGKWGHASNTSSALTAAVNSDSAPSVKVVPIDAPGRAVNIDPKTGVLVPATPSPAPIGPSVASVALAAIMALGLLIASHGASMAAGREPSADVAAAALAGGLTAQKLVGIAQDQGLVARLITDFNQFDTVAGKVNPASALAPPLNTYNPEAHQCIGAVIPWLQSVPTEASVPQPTNPDGTPIPRDQWGVFTTLGMLEVEADAKQAFLQSITSLSVRPLTMGCAAWAQRVLATPATLRANITKDAFNFLSIFSH